ncbi:translocation/assembly module TamB domain-containing protein [Bacteroidales bacterium OttesenSCG-928-J19]|nr:translocation/assembly module TamB domain-containing protein [Bacteroidales bacterium OttesenSCG-928-J19]
MKAIKYIGIILGALLFVVVIIPAGLIHTPAIQKKIVEGIADYFQEQTHTRFSIEKSEIRSFRKLTLHEVVLQEQDGDTIFNASRVAVGVKLLPLLQGKIQVNSAELYSFDVKLYKETPDSPLNIQPIIDAFASEEETKDSSIDLMIKNLRLFSGTLRYDVLNQSFKKDRLDINHLFVSNISGKIKLNQLKGKVIDGEIRRLCFREKSGLTIENISLDLQTDESHIDIGNLLIRMPQTKLEIENVAVCHTGLDNFLSDSLTFALEINKSKIGLGDLSPLLPALRSFDEIVFLDTQIEGSLEDLTIKHIHLYEDYGSSLLGNLRIQHLTSSDPNRIRVNGVIENSRIKSKYIRLFEPPEEINRLGDIAFSGLIDGYLADLYAIGEVNTSIGDLSINLHLAKDEAYALSGEASSSGLLLNELLANEDLGKISFEILLNGSFLSKDHFSGEVLANFPEFEFQGYTYENLRLEGNLANDLYGGSFSMDNSKGHIEGKASFALRGQESETCINLLVEDLKLDRTRFLKKYDSPVFNLTTEIQVKGNDPDNIDGFLHLFDFSLQTGKDTLFVKDMMATINRAETLKSIRVDSEILELEILGDFFNRSIANQIKRTLAAHIPSLVKAHEIDPHKPEPDNNFTFRAIIGDLQNLPSLLNLPFEVEKGTTLSGYFDYPGNELLTEITIPRLNLKGTSIDDCFIRAENEGDNLHLKMQGNNAQKNFDLRLGADLIAINDSIFTEVNWKSSKEEAYEGVLAFSSLFALGQGLKANIQIYPSEVIMKDSLWMVEPGLITIDNKDISIRNLGARHAGQYIYINGDIAENPEKEIQVELKDVDMEYIFDALNIPALEFGGRATGLVQGRDIYKTRKLQTELQVQRFSFNQTLFGDLDLKGVWREEEQGVEMKGCVYKNEDSFVDIDGFIYPAKERLSILFNAENADLKFLRKYLDKVAKNVSGTASGEVHLFGDLNDPTIEGIADMKNVRFGIEFLNTYFTFSDRITMTPDQMTGSNMTLYDDFGNKASVSAVANHNAFSDFSYDVKINFNDFLVFNATETSNPMFYGRVFGTGAATIKGTENQVNIHANLENTDNSSLTLNFMTAPEVTEYNDFITFIEKNKSTEDTSDTKKNGKSSLVQNSGTELNFSLNANVNNSAEIDLIMDPVSKDKISAKGWGNLDVYYGSHQPMRIIGTYTIDEGKYNFSLEQLYFLNFIISQGSKVSFTGDPYKAQLDVKAKHTVHANIGDLSEELLSYTTRSRVPVDCIIKVSGLLERPAIAFDLELPSTPELERQVANYIRTEDMMNRQILYLLVLNNFYSAPEHGSYSAGINNDYSLLTNALSNQLSNILASFSDNVEIGTQFHHSNEGELSTTEVELMLSSTFLNDRLIVYGNFGYIDNPYINTGTDNKIPLVGDFDVEYKLTKAGDIRLKGYSHYNYRYYDSQTPRATQGLGILFRKDFNHLLDLFRKKKPEKTE